MLPSVAGAQGGQDSSSRGAVTGPLTNKSWAHSIWEALRVWLFPRGQWEMEVVLGREQRSAVGPSRSLWTAEVVEHHFCGNQGRSTCNARGFQKFPEARLADRWCAGCSKFLDRCLGRNLSSPASSGLQ